MFEPRQRALLVAQRLGADFPAGVAMDQLERHGGGETVIGAARAVHLRHSAAADQRVDAETAEVLAGFEHGRPVGEQVA